MRGSDFVGHAPENVRWSLDGSSILFDWNPAGLPGDETYVYQVKNASTNVLQPDFYTSNNDYYGAYFANDYFFEYDGGLYRYQGKSLKNELIYKSANGIRNIQQWSTVDKIYFEEGNEFKAYSKSTKTIETVFVFNDGVKAENTPTQNHLTREEALLFQYLQDESETAAWRKQQRAKWHTSIPSFYRGTENVSNVQISPDGQFITFRLYTNPEVKGTQVAHHISKTGYTYQEEARSKVSDSDPNNRLAIYDLKKDTLYFVDFSTLTDIRKKPEYLKIYGDNTETYAADRNIIMHDLKYAEATGKNVFDVRSYDNKDRWIVSVDLSNGVVKELEHQHDEAWIGGPGIVSWNMVPGNLGWLKDGKTCYFQSEATGFSHLYTLNTETGTKKALTSGNWEVHEAVLSKDGTTFYLTTNQTHPGDRGFYHLSVANGNLTPVLTKPGAHEVNVSPDGKWLAVRYSSKTQPWEVFLTANKAGADWKQITHSTTEAFEAYSWYAPEVIEFKAADGVGVYARLYAPENAKKNSAAIIFVHGAGYLQNAHNWWSTYHREYMFHNLLRDNGFTVLDIDYRASEGYGRDHRTAIYRNMGGKDLSDQLDGRQLLIDSLGIDPDRIGIYGGSYGGFITLMALLKEPGKFQAGAALRSVTDWNHYNHEYTSNILNYPSTDTMAYQQSSPIHYAENLSDRLIMLHGMVDDNVQFQDVVRLSQRFIELEKVNWELAVFPVEAHGFQKASSWTDEYRRIYELFMDELILNKN